MKDLPVVTVRATNTGQDTPAYSVHIDGQDVSGHLTRVEIDLEYGEPPEVCLTYATDAIQFMSPAVVSTLFTATSTSREALDTARNPNEHVPFSLEHAHELAAAVVRSIERVTCHCHECQNPEGTP